MRDEMISLPIRAAPYEHQRRAAAFALDRLARGGGAFSDQLLCLAVADPPDPSERQALCAEFLAFLLTDECQGELHRASAFGVTDAASGYGVGDPLATMDAALRDTALQTPRCFDAGWTEAAEAIVRKFVSDDGEAPELWRRLGDRLAGKPNDFS